MHILIFSICLSFVFCYDVFELEAKYAEGHSYFVSHNFIKSEAVWRDLISQIPQMEVFWTNLATTLENQGKYSEAQKVYLEAASKLSSEQNVYINLCALCAKLFMDATIFDYGNDVRVGHANDAKLYCDMAVKRHPDVVKPWQTFGHLSTEIFEYKKAVFYLKKALELDPNNPKSNLYLATAYSRMGDLENAITQSRRSVELNPTAESYHSHAIITSVCSPEKGESLESHQKAIILHSAEQRSPNCPNGYIPVFGWENTEENLKNGVSIVVSEKSPIQKFGRPSPRLPDPKKFRGNNLVNSVSLEWGDHDLEIVKMKDVYVEGNTGIYYNDNCRVFTTGHKQVSKIVHEFLGGMGKTKLVKITEPCASLLQQNPGNYYHWMTESLSRFIYLNEMVLSKPENSHIKLLVPKMSEIFVRQTIVELLGFPESKLIWYDRLQVNTRYFFSELYFADWHWSPENDLQFPDVSRLYFPPRSLLKQLRKKFSGYGDSDFLPKHSEIKLLYLSREDATVRKITPDDERKLIVALMDVVGPANVDWITTSGLSVTQQINAFKTASIIVAPHGAGLTNMLWTRPGTSIVQFPMNPNTDNCFGYLSMALDLDYWLVPQINGFYYGQFNRVNQESINAVISVVQTIIKEKNKSL